MTPNYVDGFQLLDDEGQREFLSWVEQWNNKNSSSVSKKKNPKRKREEELDDDSTEPPLKKYKATMEDSLISQRPDCTTTLPIEIMVEIGMFTTATLEDLYSLSMVDKRWCKIIRSMDKLWEGNDNN